MDRWWTSRERAAQALEQMSADDDPQMMVGTALLALHAIGSHHLDEAAGPFGSHSLNKALNAINDDVLIGAVCKAFDDATGQPGYGATRVSGLKRRADKGARGVYSTILAGRRHPLTAIKRAGDTYVTVLEDSPEIRKALLEDESTVQSVCDKALMRHVALIASAEPVTISKDKEIIRRGEHEITVYRGKGGKFATKDESAPALSPLELKKKRREERMAAFMQRRPQPGEKEAEAESEASAPEAEKEQQLQGADQLEQELEQLDREEEEEKGEEKELSAQQYAQRKKRKARAMRRRQNIQAQIAAQQKAHADVAHERGMERALAQQKDKKRAQELVAAKAAAKQKAVAKPREAEPEEEKPEEKQLTAEQLAEEHKTLYVALTKQAARQKFAEKFRTYSPGYPMHMSIDVVPQFSSIEVHPEGSWYKVPVPLMYRPEQSLHHNPEKPPVSADQVNGYYAGVPMPVAHESDSDEVKARVADERKRIEIAAAKTMAIVHGAEHTKDRTISQYLAKWMVGSTGTGVMWAKEKEPKTFVGYEYGTMETVAKVMNNMLMDRHRRSMKENFGRSGDRFSVEVDAAGRSNSDLADSLDSLYGDAIGENIGALKVFDYSERKGRGRKQHEPYDSLGQMLVVAYHYVASGEYASGITTDPEQFHQITEDAKNDIAAFTRAAQVLQMTEFIGGRDKPRPDVSWLPYYQGHVHGRDQQNNALVSVGTKLPGDTETAVNAVMGITDKDDIRMVDLSADSRRSVHSNLNAFIPLTGVLSDMTPSTLPEEDEWESDSDAQDVLAGPAQAMQLGIASPRSIDGRMLVRPPLIPDGYLDDELGDQSEWIKDVLHKQQGLSSPYWLKNTAQGGGGQAEWLSRLVDAAHYDILEQSRGPQFF